MHVFNCYNTIPFSLHSLFFDDFDNLQLLFSYVANCTHGESRLQNGMNSTSGRAEVCVDGEWQTVCDKQFNESAASVFCKSIGLHLNSEYYYNYNLNDSKTCSCRAVLVNEFSCIDRVVYWTLIFGESNSEKMHKMPDLYGSYFTCST